jgi:hypothetical protein
VWRLAHAGLELADGVSEGGAAVCGVTDVLEQAGGVADGRARSHSGGGWCRVDGIAERGDALFARALRDKGTPMPDIVKKLTIKTGKNAGDHPSVASLYRAFAHNGA